MYRLESRVRFSEIDHTQTMTLPALVNYFQDCSTFQSEDIGLGIDALKERGKVWILSSWQIEVSRYPHMGEQICVETWANGFSGFYGTRNFRMSTKEGGELARANSIWVFMDIASGRPARPGKEDVAAYGMEAPLEMEQVSRKIRLPENAAEQEPFPVRRAQIDTNEHVNNCQYIQMAVEVLPEAERAGKIRVEYKKSAVLGDVICPKTAKEEGRSVVELCGADGKPFAVVEFKEKQNGIR